MNVGCNASYVSDFGYSNGYFSCYSNVLGSLEFCAPRDIKIIKDSTCNTIYKTSKAETKRKEGETYNE